jgi:bidirectional [NiFe] hydrogenase diaphorase subunit
MRERRKTIEFVVDDTEIDAYEGESVLHAARRHGIAIPALCYLEGLSVWGACRLCVVELAEQHQLRPACAVTVEEDMEVITDSEPIRRHRRAILELLFAEGNHVCAVCVSNGACELQDAAVAVGMDHVRFDYQAPVRSIDASHPKYVSDPNRCILCTRCVRVCDEIEGAHVWDIAGRGSEAHLVAEMGKPWAEAQSCTWCGKCVAACPTGALFYQGRAVGEMRHQPDMVARLVSAREDHQWLAPGAPND